MSGFYSRISKRQTTEEFRVRNPDEKLETILVAYASFISSVNVSEDNKGKLVQIFMHNDTMNDSINVADFEAELVLAGYTNILQEK